MSEAAQDPPEIPGYDFLRELGHGGFADVHLYRQHQPWREVAIKVLRHGADAAGRQQFADEANRMAGLAWHQGILTLHAVGESADGRPFFTMEFCPDGHFGEIVSEELLSVPYAIQVGILMASAVETAHQSGLVHRDVKPANILLTQSGNPALTDFGIASGGSGTATGVVGGGGTVPFAAPEVASGRMAGDERSDVYSLGATVYAFLAGRGPFNTDEELSTTQLVHRILHVPLPPIGRRDVPPSLERVLARAMARDRDTRYPSAADLGRALQGVEVELGLPPTPLSIGPGARRQAPRPTAADDIPTRVKATARFDPDAAAAAPSAPTARTPSWEATPPPLPHDTGIADRTIGRAPERAGGPATGPEPTPEAPPSGARRVVPLVVAAVVVVAAVALVLGQAGGSPDDEATPTTTPGSSPLVTSGVPGRPGDVRIEPSDDGQQQVVTWEAPAAGEGDSYQVFFTDGPPDLDGELETTGELELVVDTDAPICVTVEAIRGGRASDVSAEACSS